jgi:ligand-binding sensor domain-containing protein
MRKFLLLTSCLFCLWDSAFPQEYSYTHYDISDGLAGSTVYCITQDKDGFIWTGTETGVSRFDGTHFRNFTTRDGLPDVEILEMFGDSKGRVWMAPFRKSICYYYKGKIYNQENDSVLRAMRFKGNIEHFAEDATGNILIQESTRLHVVSTRMELKIIDSIHQRPITECHAISSSRNGFFLVQENDSIYEFNGAGFVGLFKVYIDNAYNLKNSGFISISPGAVVWRSELTKGCIQSLATGKVINIPFTYLNFRHVSYNIVDDTLVYTNESTGSTEYHVNSIHTKTFLPGVEVSRAFHDDEGNTWFATIGQGLYRLNSEEFRNIRLNQPLYGNCSVHSLKKLNNELLVGSNRNSIFRFRLPGMESLGFQHLNSHEKKRILFIDTLDKGRMIYGTDFTLEVRKTGRKDSLDGRGFTIKAAYLKNPHEIVFACSKGAFLMNIDTFGKLDTLCNERATTLFYRNDTTYVGTLNGLNRVTGNRKSGYKTEFLGKDIPFLRRRIAAIVQSRDGVLWIAPYDDAGIIGIKDGRVVRQIGRQQGLTSDICKTLAIEKDYLWVGTDKGLNKIDLHYPDAPIMQFTATDGLGSNVINTICVDSPMVYVGTPAGLSVFDETRVNNSDRCRLVWLDISSSGQSFLGDSANLNLSYRQNNIHFEFVAISYKSAGNILYKYRLKGLDTAWKTTKETFLEYPTLPYGDYELQIRAINKFGTESRLLSLPFHVSTPFWRSVWFNVAVLCCFLFLTWFLVSFYIRRVRRREQDEERLNRRMTELEHTALQAQMNPHFIFNCLNSIQQYIFDQDIFAANKYISGFAKLIRATLQNTSKPFIALPDEISYLSGYLSLEKLRFKEKMDYLIEVDPSINDETYIIPPMLIQPYVENSMRHGLRHKVEGKGYIHITFLRKNNRLAVTVEDNGIGRKHAGSFKTREHIEYQSKGMSLTAARIRIMNAKYRDNILIEVTDLEDPVTGKATGTRVIMEFPLFHILLENQAI